jgi:predicted aldo/keto reductase-like oxidoreductase
VAINDVLRIDSYFTNYREEKIAMQRYSDLDENLKPLKCETCSGYCESKCPYNLPVRGKLISAHERLTLM